MVSRNNNIKSGLQSTEKNDTPVYPFQVDIASIPERKYLFGIYSLSKLSFILILTAIMLSLFLIIKAYSVKIKPYFVYWDKYETKFKRLKTLEEPKPLSTIRKVTENTYLSEFFIREYLNKTFNFSTKLVQNEESWCNCINNEQLKNSDFLNISKKCYICNFSSPNIYNNFIKNQKPTYDLMIQQGTSQQINIIDMELLRTLEISGNKSFISNFFPQKNVQILSEYKVNFIVENINANKVINQDVITSYITVAGLKDYPRSKTVTAISYMFNPNYELILDDYKKAKAQELKEVQSEINL
ncbi:MAG: hypothetical protein K2M23_01200 [Alphaproteobacteria bacterium]|nr:hypothetical protein [Alphaproteobacteria bacterium]